MGGIERVKLQKILLTSVLGVNESENRVKAHDEFQRSSKLRSWLGISWNQANMGNEANKSPDMHQDENKSK